MRRTPGSALIAATMRGTSRRLLPRYLITSGRPPGSRLDELVAHLVHGDDEGLLEALSELGAQVRDVGVHGARGDAEILVHAPDLLEQLFARDGASAVLDQVLEQLKFLVGERDGGAVLVDLARLEAHLDVPELADGRPGPRRGAGPALHQALHPRDQLLHPERLGSIPPTPGGSSLEHPAVRA